MQIEEFIKRLNPIMVYCEDKPDEEVRSYICCMCFEYCHLNYWTFISTYEHKASEFIRIYLFNKNRFTKEQMDKVFKIHQWLRKLVDKENDTCI